MTVNLILDVVFLSGENLGAAAAIFKIPLSFPALMSQNGIDEVRARCQVNKRQHIVQN